MLDRQAEQARKREREAEEKRMEEKRLEQERLAASSNWRRNPVAPVPLPPTQLRSERDADRDTPDGPRKDRDGDWRSKVSAATPAPPVSRDEPPPRPKAEAWRPSGERFASGFLNSQVGKCTSSISEWVLICNRHCCIKYLIVCAFVHRWCQYCEKTEYSVQCCYCVAAVGTQAVC